MYRRLHTILPVSAYLFISAKQTKTTRDSRTRIFSLHNVLLCTVHDRSRLTARHLHIQHGGQAGSTHPTLRY
ncbi:hypothetical protein GDO81_028317 [Engystomops pustulosus]|uniref:Secreted protein n=1 Tax=Engystomops pustulosus TaxID=76066 RepID=A0AAV6ZJE2_ENGPU|nr:hypothetical protein GDO81_028317 [Engystomops pustulosus]